MVRPRTVVLCRATLHRLLQLRGRRLRLDQSLPCRRRLLPLLQFPFRRPRLPLDCLQSQPQRQLRCRHQRNRHRQPPHQRLRLRRLLRARRLQPPLHRGGASAGVIRRSRKRCRSPRRWRLLRRQSSVGHRPLGASHCSVRVRHIDRSSSGSQPQSETNERPALPQPN